MKKKHRPCRAYVFTFFLFFLAASCASSPDTQNGGPSGAAEQPAVRPDSALSENIVEPELLPGEDVPAPDAGGTRLPEEPSPAGEQSADELPSVDEQPVLPAGGEQLLVYDEPDISVVTESETLVSPEPQPLPVLPEPPPALLSGSSADTAAPENGEGKTEPEEMTAGNSESVPDGESSDQTEPEGGIWEYEYALPYVPENSAPVYTPPPVISRNVTVGLNQLFDVPYPGQGWVYLGDTAGQNGISYLGRKLNERDTLFSLQGKQAGTYVLHFTKQDLLADTYIDDYVQVTVTGEAYTGSQRVRVPDYTGKAPEVTDMPAARGETVSSEQSSEPAGLEQKQTSSADTAGTGSVSSVLVPDSAPRTGWQDQTRLPQTDESVPSGSPVYSEPAVMPAASQSDGFDSYTPAQLLDEAGKAVAAADAPKAHELLDVFFRKTVSDLDRGWYLRGQAYEINGETKNIRKALEAYETLTEAFPGSSLWKTADDRITYIKRFYFNIR